MAATMIQEWKQRLETETNEEIRGILQFNIDAYERGRMTEQLSSSSSSSTSRTSTVRYNHLIGNKGSGGLRLYLFVNKHLNANVAGAKGVNLSVLRVLPFKDVVATGNITKEDGDHTLVFDLGDGEPFYWTTLSNIVLGLFSTAHAFKEGQWHVVDGVTIKRVKLNDGRVFTNVNAKSIKVWEEGPTRLQMSELCTRLFSHNHYGLRAPPLQVLGSRSEAREGVPRKIDSNGKETEDYTEIDARLLKITDANVQLFNEENGYRSYEYGQYRKPALRTLLVPFSVPNIRRFETMPATHSNNGVICGLVAWDQNTVVDKKSDTAKTRAGSSPFDNQVTASAQSQVEQVFLENDKLVREAFLIKTTIFTPLSQALGILNVSSASKIFGEILPKIHMVISGDVNVSAACAMDINTSVPLYTKEHKTRVVGVPVNVFQVYVPVITTIRTVGVQISKEYAVRLINSYIKTSGAVVKKDTAVDLKTLSSSKTHGIAGQYAWCAEQNKLPDWTDKRVYNMMETPMPNTLKLDGEDVKNWRFYSVSNAVFTDRTNAHIQDVLRFHESEERNDEEAERLEALCPKFDQALRALAEGDEGEYFTAPVYGGGVGLFQVVFAVHRSLDHDDIEIFKHNDFDIPVAMKKEDVVATGDNTVDDGDIDKEIPLSQTALMDERVHSDTEEEEEEEESVAASSVADDVTTADISGGDDDDNYSIQVTPPVSRRQRSAPHSKPAKKRRAE